MKIEIAKHERMSESGSSLLRLIQNQDTPLLDLFVRESIQNSLDAAKSTDSPVTIEINVGNFNSKQLSGYLEGIEDNLNNKFNLDGKAYKFLEIRDSNTTGLTGPTSYSDVEKNKDGIYDFGNLLKLVYEICKPQLNEGSGGSWGLGKTIYFRLGIGLVLYYTRVFESNKFVSRLAACFVENENSSNAILPKNEGINRGIAWWGDIFDGETSVPIEDEIEINEILSVFGIEPYLNSTGTTIIIPYINEKKLLSEVYSTNDEFSQNNRPYWTESISDYLRIAVQRWYAPRLNNSKYTYGAFLKAIVNGKKISTEEMLPLFRIIRELYIKANGMSPSDSFLSDLGIDIETDEILTRGSLVTSSIAGTLAYVKVTKEQMMMLPPNNVPSPYNQIDNFYNLGEESNLPIISFTRKPGMIVGYDYNSTWTHGMNKTEPNEFLIGIFVANSNNIVNCNEHITLDEYIRRGEKADHTSWQDHSISGLNKRIILLIQQQVVRKINQRYNNQAIDQSIRKHIGLGHKLANILLPSYSFGRQPNHQINNDSKDKFKLTTQQVNSNSSVNKNGDSSTKLLTMSNKRNTNFKFGNPSFNSNGIHVPFSLFVKDISPVNIQLMVNTDYKKYGYELWESDEGVGKAFPLNIVDFTIDKLVENGDTKVLKSDNIRVDEKTSVCQTGDIRIELKKANISKKACLVVITPKKEHLQFYGNITFISTDPSIKWLIDINK